METHDAAGRHVRPDQRRPGTRLGGRPPRAGRGLGFTAHVAQDDRQQYPTAIDGRTTRHEGYADGQRCRSRIAEGFGWGKTIGLLRKLRHRGRPLVGWVFAFTMATYNLVRIHTLIRAGVTARDGSRPTRALLPHRSGPRTATLTPSSPRSHPSTRALRA